MTLKFKGIQASQKTMEGKERDSAVLNMKKSRGFWPEFLCVGKSKIHRSEYRILEEHMIRAVR